MMIPYFGGSNGETIDGNADNDTLFGNGGGDIFDGGSGNDIMRGGAGGDSFTGGSGVDTVLYANSDAAVTIDLQTGLATGGHASGDTFGGVEVFLGSNFGDELNGNGSNNTLRGGSGNDIIRGRDGVDRIQGGEGSDVLNGGNGFDFLDYTNSTAGVTVNLTTSSVSGGDATGDIIFNFEGVFGSESGDSLTGSSGSNNIIGGGGADTLRGYFGNDTLTGGSGADIFDFDNNGGFDTVTDFQNDLDMLDLTAYNFASTAQVLGLANVVGADVVIGIDANDQITLTGFAPNIGDLSDDLII